MNTKILLTASLIAVFTVGLYAESALAVTEPYLGNVGDKGETGSHTLEEALALQADRVKPTPDGDPPPAIFDPSTVGSAAVLSAVVFGGIAGAFFLKGRSGKYAAMGRG